MTESTESAPAPSADKRPPTHEERGAILKFFVHEVDAFKRRYRPIVIVLLALAGAVWWFGPRAIMGAVFVAIVLGWIVLEFGLGFGAKLARRELRVSYADEGDS